MVDSSSVEVARKARRPKTNELDAQRPLKLLARYWMLGEEDTWSVVNVPSRTDDARRQLHRELEKLREERAAPGNRIKGLLATQGG